jgi:hypothetical protein
MLRANWADAAVFAMAAGPDAVTGVRALGDTQAVAVPTPRDAREPTITAGSQRRNDCRLDSWR